MHPMVIGRRARGLVGGAAVALLAGTAGAVVTVVNPIGDRGATIGSSALVISLAGRYDDPNLTGTIVKFRSVLGTFNIELFDLPGPGRARVTPATAANFLNYVNQGRYGNLVLNRVVAGFWMQAGAYAAAPAPALVDPVANFGTIRNEPGNPNLRGTIAMARVSGLVDSASNQWFINLADNRAALDALDGGFTAFGRVLGDGLAAVDALAAVPTFEFGGDFADIPLRGYTPQDFQAGVNPRTDQLVTFAAIEVVPEITYSATSSNNALVNPVIVGGRLVLNLGAAGSGPATITLRATSADGSFVDDAFVVTVAASPPTTGRLDVSPARIAVRGDLLSLTASGLSFLGPVSAVSFFRDANGDGSLQVGSDTLLDFDDVGADGFATVLPTNDPGFGFVVGGNLVFATGTAGGGTPVVAAGFSVNEAPVLGLLARSPAVANSGDMIRLDALDAFDRDGTISVAWFFRDNNGDGVLQPGVDPLLGRVALAGDGLTLFTPASGFPAGSNQTIFAIVTDNEGASSAAQSVQIRINAPPAIGGLAASLPVIRRGQPLILTASGVGDVDSGAPPFLPAIARVEFYRDFDFDGELALDRDLYLGQATTGVNGSYAFTLSEAVTANLARAAHRFFAVAVDADGGRSTVASLDILTFDFLDLNGDGAVDPDDLADYITAYFSQSPVADINRDGYIDPDDLSDYITAYFSL